MKFLLIIFIFTSGCASTTLNTDSGVSRQQLLLLPKFITNSMGVDAYKEAIKNAENNNKLAIWILRAGITKKITFHCSRHSYAVLLLENKTDIYSVAKMLGHKDMKSTLIYLKFTDELKLKAMNSLPNFNL